MSTQLLLIKIHPSKTVKKKTRTSVSDESSCKGKIFKGLILNFDEIVKLLWVIIDTTN